MLISAISCYFGGILIHSGAIVGDFGAIRILSGAIR